MNRIEKVREYIDHILLNMSDPVEKRCGYVHLYGVSQLCGLIALKRNENAELAIIAGMLHDLYYYKTLDSKDHAPKGATMAREVLGSLNLFSNAEINQICSAIANHSNKDIINPSFDEVLIDADVLQHYLYNPLLAASKHSELRLHQLKKELNLL